VDKLTYASNSALSADLESNSLYRFAKIDIVDFEPLFMEFVGYKPDTVIHLAAETHVDRSILSPMDFINTNVLGTANVLQASLCYWMSLRAEQAEDFRMLHVSTDEVFGSLGTEGKFIEQSRYAPNSPYSASKAASDHLVRAWYSTYKLPIIVTHCSNNYGPYQHSEKLVPTVITRCLSGDPIPVYGSGENVRDWLYVEDHCEALIRVMQSGAVGETYNIGGNNEQRNIDLVRMICNTMDQMVPRPSGGKYRDLIALVGDRPGHDHRYAVDSSKIRRELGWSPKHDHLSGFNATIAWYLEALTAR
jgi:dTDP-glucose 4,6-dehydratase